MALGTRSREEIKRDVVEHLYWDNRVDASDVKTEVSVDKVVLRGNVPTILARRAAEDDVRAVAGVHAIENRLVVEFPPGTAIPTDNEIKANLDNSLLWHASINSGNINTAVDGGWVTLRGSVNAYWKKAEAENVVSALTGVTGVTNELTVVPTNEVEDQLIADEITAALERNINIDVQTVDVKVEHGIVTLSGGVSSVPALRTAQEVAECTPGVVDVINDLVVA